MAGRSKLHTTFLENFLWKTNSLEKNSGSYIRNSSEETLDYWQTFPAQFQNCFQLIHRRLSKSFFWKIHSLLFVFDHSARRSDLWRKLLVLLSEEHSVIPEKLSRDSLLSLNSIVISALEQKILRTFVTVFQYGW